MRLRLSGRASPARPGRDTPEAADVALIDRIADGNVAAFDDLFRCYSPRLKRFIGTKREDAA